MGNYFHPLPLQRSSKPFLSEGWTARGSIPPGGSMIKTYPILEQLYPILERTVGGIQAVLCCSQGTTPALDREAPSRS